MSHMSVRLFISVSSNWPVFIKLSYPLVYMFLIRLRSNDWPDQIITDQGYRLKQVPFVAEHYPIGSDLLSIIFTAQFILVWKHFVIYFVAHLD